MGENWQDTTEKNKNFRSYHIIIRSVVFRSRPPPPPPLDPPPLLIWGAKLAKGVRDSAIYKEYSHCKRLKAVIMCFVFTAAQGVVIGECGDG